MRGPLATEMTCVSAAPWTNKETNKAIPPTEFCVIFFFSEIPEGSRNGQSCDAGLAHGDSLSRFIRIIRIICCTCWDLHLYRKIMVTLTEEDIYFLSQKKKEILWVGSCALRSRSTASHGGHISPKIEVKE